MRITPLLIALVAVAPAASVGRTAPGRPTLVAATYGHPGTLVPVRGARRINLTCVGTGRTTVLFLSGLGSGTFDWRKIQPAIGRVTRACAYDRAGYGFSDPATTPSDVTSAIDDLHSLLHSKAITAPIVLVGHSLGGLYATTYALRYPSDVVGMVLVDPAFSGQTGQIAKAVGPAAAGRMEAWNKQMIVALDRCVELATTGRLSLPSEQASDCLDNPADPDPDVHRERNRQAKSPAFERALRSEYEMANISDADGQTIDDHQTGTKGATLGTTPLVVLTRGDSEALPGLSADEIAKVDLAWRAGHDKLAALSSVGINAIVPHSKHFVQLDQPKAVTREILLVLQQLQR